MSAPAYAIARLETAAMTADLIAYLEHIDATLEPFGGRFLVHGGRITVLEGKWRGDLVVIAFPDGASAEGWYASPAYRAILPLRTGSAAGEVFLIDGVGARHRATDILAA